VGARHPLRTARITAELVAFLASSGRRAEPFKAYARLRGLEPAHHSPIGVWLLTGHAEVAAALRDPKLSSNDHHIDLATLHLGPLKRVLGRGQGSIEQGPFFDRPPGLMLFQDPPNHSRLRRLVGREFTARRVEALTPRIRAIADDLVGDLLRSDSGDLMAGFAYPFPARVICELIGVPADEAENIVDHAPALAGGLDPGPLLTVAARDAANDATTAIVAYLEDLVERRRRSPGDDLLSGLLAHEDEAGGLAGDELIGMLILLLIAGHETTANLLGNGLVALLQRPAALDALRADPSLYATAVEELLRFDAPVQMTMRVAREPVTLGDGRTIRTGSVVICCTGAANRDPSVFANADALDLHRPENPHLAFGGGIHHCIGAPLARLEARIALRSILDNLDDLQLARPPRRRPSFAIRGLDRLDLHWKAATVRGRAAPIAAPPPRRASGA
jgi:cytochrome P450